MRITQSMLSQRMLLDMQANYDRLSRLQDEVASGQRINTPSDDPVGVGFVMQYKAQAAYNAQYQQNAQAAQGWVNYTDTIMSQANEVMQRARDLAVQGASDTQSSDARKAIGSEVGQLYQQLVTIGNSQYNGKYIFNGQQTTVAPYQIPSAVGAATNDGQIQYDIGDGVFLGVNTSGNAFFGQGVADATASTQTSGTMITKSRDLSNIATVPVNIAAGVNDQLVVTANGTTKTIAIGAGTYSALKGSSGLETAIQSAVDTAFGTNQVSVSDDGSGHLSFATAAGLPVTVSDSVANAATVLYTVAKAASVNDQLPSTVQGTVDLSALPAANPVTITAGVNDQFRLIYHGTSQAITIPAGVYTSLTGPSGIEQAVQNGINQAFGVNQITVGDDGSGHLSFTTVHRGDSLSVSTDVSNAANVLFGSAAATASSDNAFSVLNELQNGLNTNDSSIIQDALGRIDSRMQRMMEQRADTGARANRVQLGQNRLTDLALNIQQLLSGVQDADMAKTITDLKTAETVHNASLQVGARVIQPTLVDFLK